VFSSSITASGLILVVTVAVIGVLHTAVPDHWAPIALIARQRAWSRRETASAAAQAGVGHVVTTLIIGLLVWFAGVQFAARFGGVVDAIASVALVLFGSWVALGAWRDLRKRSGYGHSHGLFGDHHHDYDNHDTHHLQHDHAGLPEHASERHRHDDDAADDPLYAPLSGDLAVLTRHAHAHRHGGAVHVHWHDHAADTAHEINIDKETTPPPHLHKHKTTGRTALLLILGSSPMVEGIPAFFAASRYGGTLVALMAVVFALSTIATYVALCVLSAAGLQRVSLGPIERYGEVISGAFIALVGVVFWVWPVI
jgi:hypothetical protein